MTRDATQATKTVAGLAGLRQKSHTGGLLARDLARSNEHTKARRLAAVATPELAGAAPTSGEGGGHARATMRMVLRGTARDAVHDAGLRGAS